MSGTQEEFLLEVTAYNIKARYPDYKKSFQRKANEEFTLDKIARIEEIQKWLKEIITDIDLAVFLDQDEIDGFNEDVQLMHLTRKVDLGIEPHCFSRKDFENPDPFVQEIIANGERVL
jgi:predicted RNA-binding protein Jag